MKYYANDIHGGHHGPLTEEQLIALADEGLIRADSAVKKEIMRGWFPASDLKFLAPHLSAGETGTPNAKEDIPGTSAPDASVKSTFENKLLPVHAGLLLRISAALHDLILLAVVLLLIFTAGILTAFCLSETVKDGPEVQAVLKSRQPADKKGENGKAKKKARAKSKETPPEDVKAEEVKEERRSVETSGRPSVVSDEEAGYLRGSIWKDTTTNERFVCLSASKNKAVWCPLSRLKIIAAAAWLLILLAGSYLFLIRIALTAQTPGMHYYGIFVSDAKDPMREVLELRAVSEYLLSLIFWIAAPVLLILGKPTIAENITGTRIIRTAAKK